MAVLLFSISEVTQSVNQEGQAEAGHSLILSLSGPDKLLAEMPGVVGWEKNDRGQLAPRSVQ
jgi:hypothetical protein